MLFLTVFFSGSHYSVENDTSAVVRTKKARPSTFAKHKTQHTTDYRLLVDKSTMNVSLIVSYADGLTLCFSRLQTLLGTYRTSVASQVMSIWKQHNRVL
jgi:hypothetical protein